MCCCLVLVCTILSRVCVCVFDAYMFPYLVIRAVCCDLLFSPVLSSRLVLSSPPEDLNEVDLLNPSTRDRISSTYRPPLPVKRKQSGKKDDKQSVWEQNQRRDHQMTSSCSVLLCISCLIPVILYLAHVISCVLLHPLC